MRRAPGAAPAGQAGTGRAAEQRKKSKDRPGARPTATAARREPEAPAVTAAPSAGAAMTAGIHPGTGFALPGTAMLGGRAATIQDWRRAIVMQEILAPPLAIREQHGNDYPI
jgi:hypothetical protein